jgi:hypothetical protein
MKELMRRYRRAKAYALVVALLFTARAMAPQQFSGSTASRLADPFATGWMLSDTNGDGIADFVEGKIIVPGKPTAAENAVAANLAARLGYGSTGLTLPIVVTSGSEESRVPKIFVGRAAVVAPAGRLAAGEGGVFELNRDLAVVGADDEGLMAAGDAYSARAPYQWRVPGDKLSQLGDLVGVTYAKGKAGVNRAFLRDGRVLELNPPAAAANAGAAAAGTQPQADASGNPPPRLDLAALYTSRGLFTGTPRMPLPSTLDSHLFVPAGPAGIAMANLAARMGMEATGITLPLASSADTAASGDVRNKAVIAGNSAVAREAERKLRAPHGALAPGEGEVDVVDDAFARRPAILVRGDETGAAAAVDYAAGHLPNLWETGKQHLGTEEIRYDLHRFFSMRSSAGQAATAMYHLERWAKELEKDAKDVKAEVYADVADPKLATFAAQVLPAGASIKAAGLHAGTRCCEDFHFRAPGVEFQQQPPTFAEDITIPWEGKRLVDAVRRVLPRIRRGQDVKINALVSESIAARQKIVSELYQIFERAGIDPHRVVIRVLCAYKPGYSWLMEDVATELASKPLAGLRIEFAKNVDPTGMRSMWSEARWVQELYPVDEMLARKLNIPLEKVTLHQFEPGAGSPTYRARAFDAAGKETLTREFTVPTVTQPYNGALPRYEQVQVDTGWVKLEAGGRTLLDERIKTDTEEFWDHYQRQTLPKIWQAVMSQVHGDLRSEFAPPFDTLKIDIHMSEPDYNLDLDRERISSLEALQEDTFYSTDNFMSMMGDLETGRPINYIGRVIPVVHRGEDGQDGRVRIEFYGKAEANPLVRLTWTDAQGVAHKRERNLPALTGEMSPRLVQARVSAHDGVQRLAWVIPADFAEDRYEDWLRVEGQDQVDRSIFSVERARGQLLWLERMHAAGVYADELAYPHLKQMGIEFELPLPVTAKPDTPPERIWVEWAITQPATRRPQITDVKPIATSPVVQLEEPISPAENAAILARMAQEPGVTVYWMGSSYLGENIWAADILAPSPAALRSVAKETTTKPVIVYSGRQHANEVSSTTHILMLASQLVWDPKAREALKHVNVVIHPITNPDGAQLSVDLAKITPDNMLHPGYHGSLSADVSAGQTETDPVYPESRTRKQLIDAWLPDAFLNPHGYPSHEWVQPFSEYSGWVQSRQGANNGRAWWIPRGWFTSMGYLRDETHPYSKSTAFTIRDRIVTAEREVPGLLALEQRMNSRYERFGQRWQPKNMFQPLVNDIRIYMSLKGAAGRGGGAAGAGSESGQGTVAPGSGGVGGLSADITWDAAYTEAPDETAHGEYMKLMASAGLAFDWVHLNYLAQGDQRITRSEREAAAGVQFRVERARPVLPKQ